MKIVKIRKTIRIDGFDYRIATTEEAMYNDRIMINTRVVAPNGGVLPINFEHKQTLKSMVEQTKVALKAFKTKGVNVNYDVTKKRKK